MWVRIEGVLYNLSLVQSVSWNQKDSSIQLYWTGIIPFGGDGVGDSTYIEFNNNDDAKIAYKHIISAINIPMLNKNLSI